MKCTITENDYIGYMLFLRIHLVVKNANLLMKPVASPAGHDVREVDKAIAWVLIL